MLDSVVELRRAVELIDAGDKVSGEAGERNRPLVPRQDRIGQLAADRSQVSVFLIRPPALSGMSQQTHKMKLILLIIGLIHGRTTLGDKGISVIEYVEIINDYFITIL